MTGFVYQSIHDAYTDTYTSAVHTHAYTHTHTHTHTINVQGYAFEYSVLFYGYYDSGANEPYYPPPSNPHPHIGLHYNLPLAYLLVIVSLFVISAATLLVR